MSGRRRRVGGTIPQGAFLVAVSGLSILGNADLHAPPRYDGAGYAVLARSLAEGQGYRAIDHPDQPRHTHFPPGYPLLLATLWRCTGTSIVAAHAVSAVCTVGAVLAAWIWLRGLYRSRVAFGISLALAANWTWGRIGASIQSEPLFLLLAMLSLGAASRARRRHGFMHGLVVGGLIGAATLTRHIGVCLVVAVIIDQLRDGRRAQALALVVGAALVLAPWVGWLWAVGQDTQLALIPRTGLIDRLGAQALFYLRRVPDQVVGPLIEVATVFRPQWERPATLVAAAASGLVLGGWTRTLGEPRRRLVGWAALSFLAALLVWPFTEAGRFLVPLVPLILIGAVDGLTAALRLVGPTRPQGWAVTLVLLASLPYPLYALTTGRAAANRQSHADFDAACAWLAQPTTRPGPVLSRHPGEIFWQTGRAGLTPTTDDPAAIQTLVDRYDVAYLLVDDQRYANAPTNPLRRYVAEQALKPAWQSGPLRLYQVP
jgi:hypothetical protein